MSTAMTAMEGRASGVPTADVVKSGVEWISSVDLPLGRWAGLTTLGVFGGLISGVAEALGASVRYACVYARNADLLHAL